jgi:O-antigen ligase
MAMGVTGVAATRSHLDELLTRQRRFQVLAIVIAALLAGLLPPTLSIAVLAVGAVTPLLLDRPILAVYLLVFAVPYESLKQIQFGGLNATVTEYFAFCGGLALFAQGVLRRQIELKWAYWRRPLLIFALVMIASMTQATDLKLSIKELLKLAEMLLTYLLVLGYVDTPSRLRRLLLLVVLAATSQALFGILQTAGHFGPASFVRGGTVRGSGTFDQPNPFAGYLNLTLPLLFAAVLTGVPLVGKWTRHALVILSLAVLLSLSRGALLGTFAGLGLIVSVLIPRWRPLLTLLIGLFVFILVATAVGLPLPGIGDKIALTFGLNGVDVVNPTPITWPVAERLAHVVAGWNMFLDHPLLGVGIGNYAAAYPHYQVAPVWGPALGHAHNYYVNAAAEAGVPGLAAFLLLLASGFWIAAHLYRQARDPLARTLALGTLGVLATVAVHSFFDDIFVHAMESQLALVVGMATVACRLSVQDGRDASVADLSPSAYHV